MNGLSVYQIKVGPKQDISGYITTISTVCLILMFVCFQVHRKYTGEDFDEDLRTVLRRSGCKNEKIAFIMDESNVLDSGFLERMNTLLANGEVTCCCHDHVLLYDSLGNWISKCCLFTGSRPV